MKAGITSLALRSSPTRRSTIYGVTRLAPISSSSRTSSAAALAMLAKANKNYEANAPPKHSLTKQLFPSSSPSASSGDIRDQLRKPGSTAFGPATATSASTASARTDKSLAQPLNNRAPNATSAVTFGSMGKGSLMSLCNNTNSFQQGPEVVDLTSSSHQASNPQQGVFFAEDDFSDDDNLDLDYAAPSTLPSLPASQRLQKENLPPPLKNTQSETAIPWSSSPPSHLLPAAPQRTTSATSAHSQNTLKRESSGEGGSFDDPAPKKAKKRVLPASFTHDDHKTENPRLPRGASTPSSKPRADFWDPSASAIQEQKRQWKSQHQSRKDTPDAEAAAADMQAAVEAQQGAKSAAITLSEEQLRVIDMVVHKNQSVFFTGPAGTGKSVLMRSIIKEMKRKYTRDPERVAVTASTGLAACNIGGMTLHSFSGIGLGKEDAQTLIKKIRRNPKAKNRWLRTKCLIIDEVSMVDGDLFDKLSQIGRTIRNNGRPWGGIQLVITGDFFQLPPVPDAEKREAKFAFDAATWDTSIDHTIGLSQVFRQRDPEFARMLNEMRLGKITDQTERAFKALARPLRFDDGVDLAELFPTRMQVEQSNDKRLRDLPGKVARFDALDSGDKAVKDKLLANMMAPKSLDLKIGAQVMLIKNLDETLVNGSLGKVVSFSDEKTFDMTHVEDYDSDHDDSMAKAKRKLKAFSRDSDGDSDGQKYPVVQFMSTSGMPRVILCQPEEWKVELPNGEVQAKRTQLPLILAWALSIHKAQGQTLERVTVNLGKVFEKGQAYVALSRATSQDGLRVVGFNKTKVMAHPRVVAFYNKLYSAEVAFKAVPATIGGFLANRNGASKPQPNPDRQVVNLNDEEEAMASYGY